MVFILDDTSVNFIGLKVLEKDWRCRRFPKCGGAIRSGDKEEGGILLVVNSKAIYG